MTYQGQPLAGASVVFQPESGPIAIATTDAQGKFELSTQGQPGAVTGQHTVTVTAFEETGKTIVPEEGAATVIDQPTEGEQIERKSLIPEKFGKASTSGLTATVTKNAADNQFEFDLRD